MKRRPDPKKILADNIRMLLHEAKTMDTDKLLRKSGVSPRGLGYILAMERSSKIDTVDDIARAFNLPVWQMLMPNLKEFLKSNGQLDIIIDDYIKSSDEGKGNIYRIAQMESRYATPQ